LSHDPPEGFVAPERESEGPAPFSAEPIAGQTKRHISALVLLNVLPPDAERAAIRIPAITLIKIASGFDKPDRSGPDPGSKLETETGSNTDLPSGTSGFVTGDDLQVDSELE
jgi:hypothetical protein